VVEVEVVVGAAVVVVGSTVVVVGSTVVVVGSAVVVVGSAVVVVELEVVVGATVVVVDLGGLGGLGRLGRLRACRRQDQRYSDRCGNEREDDDSEAHAGSFYRLHGHCLDEKRINGGRPP
jgi:hypothetical protein